MNDLLSIENNPELLRKKEAARVILRSWRKYRKRKELRTLIKYQ